MSNSKENTNAKDNSNIDYKKAEKRLLELKNEYETRIDKIEDHIAHPEEEMVKDDEDQAIVSRQNDVRQSLMLEAKDGLNKVMNALSRIEKGTYGYCNVCGKQIGEKRLEAVPYTELCIEHAA